MGTDDGAGFARLLLGAFDAMVKDVRAELVAAGHPDLTVPNEFAMQTIDAGAGNAADLARELGVSRQAAAKTINALEALGYIQRGADEVDARRKNLAVSDRGREAVAIGEAAFDKTFQRWRVVVGSEQASATAQALRKLTQTVERTP